MIRQKDQPWIALGMSRATWYRLGKPDKPRRKFTHEEQLEGLAKNGMAFSSWRTYQRTMRALTSPLMPYVKSGQMSVNQADKILASPGGAEGFLKMVEIWNAKYNRS